MDLNELRNLVTLFSFVLFCALAIWTWLPRQRRALDEAANLVFEGEADEPSACIERAYRDARGRGTER